MYLKGTRMIRKLAALLGVALSISAAPVFAQQNAMRIIVAFPPGGPVDFVARSIAEQLGKELGQRVIVENKAGANGAIAAETVMRAAPDGTTLWLTSVGAAAINPSLYDKLPYDMKADFAPVSQVVNNVELMVVNINDPASDAAQFVAAAKRRSDPTPFASTGIGSIPHFAMEQLKDSGKVNLLHVPYKGAAPAITDLIGGQVAGFFGDVPGLINHVRSGRLKAVGIADSQRHPLLPDVKTLAEQGLPGVDSSNWYALFAPAKTPAATIDKLSAAVRRVVADPKVNERLASNGAQPKSSSPQELAELLDSDTTKWANMIKAKGIKR
jgi:tripartite-type tricarboxylate transporter receptor subunit TctC